MTCASGHATLIPEANGVSWIASLELAAESWGSGEEVKSLKEAEMIYAGVEQLKERAHHEWCATLVCRLASLKFGGETAERLSKLIEEIADSEGIARIGERIIECETGAELLARVVQQVLDRHPEAEHTMLWEALRYWVLGGAESGAIVEEVLEEAKSPKGAGMPYAGVEELKERAYREGLRQARAERLATVVGRQARLKFGVETSERLSKLMEGIADPERISRIGERISECETGAELLARARED